MREEEAEAAATVATPAHAPLISDGAGEQAPVPLTGIKMPWHVRHARVLLVGAGLAAAAGVAAFSYYVWSLRADPLERSLGVLWREGAKAPAASAVPAPSPVPAPPVSRPAAPRQSVGAAATFPAQAAVVRPEPARPAVTHTQRGKSAAPAEPARPAAESAPQATVPVQKTACAPAVAALGLCDSAVSKRER